MIYILLLLLFILHFIYNKIPKAYLNLLKKYKCYTSLLFLVIIYLIYKNIFISLIIILCLLFYLNKKNIKKKEEFKNNIKKDRCFQISKYDIRYKKISPVNKAFQVKIDKTF